MSIERGALSNLVTHWSGEMLGAGLLTARRSLLEAGQLNNQRITTRTTLKPQTHNGPVPKA
ncbi:MAG: hypothetical protein DMG96_08960 [Acidobacteria bacterium]|nr:MAG: hypothetical protein DMG96_08960 [Acidobacteriota bacterium]